MKLAKRHDSKEAEPRLQKFWEKNKIYSFNPKSKKKIYSIDTPPPTVSGKMHMGHAFSYSQEDFVARYKRMKGFNVFYPFGTDDNGLPTQRLIEKEKKVKAEHMGREKFRKFCLEILEKELRPKYLSDWKKIGMSCDFNMFYTTINDHCRRISQKSFIDLYKAGKEYRKEAPAMYCPACKTAISQVECEDKELGSSFNDLVFKVGSKKLVIATTRPELLPACAAVFYHPDDKRYKNLKGKKAEVPLFDFEVPILEDERANPEKGTGAVMCCTFGDTVDMEWQKVHDLPIKMAISSNGKMSNLAGKYEGMGIKEARKAIIEDLKEKGLLIKEEPIKHVVNVHERCGTEIEFIHSKQWFIKYLDLKKDMLKWGKELIWHPTHMKNRYDNWVNGLAWDWCISRQIYFGIPFPVWYCSECEEVILAKEKDLPVDPLIDIIPIKKCPKCGCRDFIPEKDIINTWATSSLTPQIAAALVPKLYSKLYPMNLRPQAHDIISFWLFNTVVKSRLHNKINPWKDVMISGWALDPNGKKMSKSKGNVIEPQVMIEKYSADALRFWAASSKLGEDLPFKEKEMVAGQKTINKLWNASNFCLMHLENYSKGQVSETFDKWILSKLNRLIKESTESFESYEYSKTKSGVEKFFWHTFCDYYLEIVKDRLYNPKERGVERRKSAQQGLYNSILNVLKLIAPIMPHITEEIYQFGFKKFEKDKSIHLSKWPEFNKKDVDEESEKIGDLGIEIINIVRKFKSDKQMSLKGEINGLVLLSKEREFEKKIDKISKDLKGVLKVKQVLFEGKTSLKSDRFKLKIGINL
jgi:valyl-tRNA synthetase